MRIIYAMLALLALTACAPAVAPPTPLNDVEKSLGVTYGQSANLAWEAYSKTTHPAGINAAPAMNNLVQTSKLPFVVDTFIDTVRPGRETGQARLCLLGPAPETATLFDFKFAKVSADRWIQVTYTFTQGTQCVGPREAEVVLAGFLPKTGSGALPTLSPVKGGKLATYVACVTNTTYRGNPSTQCDNG